MTTKVVSDNPLLNTFMKDKADLEATLNSITPGLQASPSKKPMHKRAHSLIAPSRTRRGTGKSIAEQNKSPDADGDFFNLTQPSSSTKQVSCSVDKSASRPSRPLAYHLKSLGTATMKVEVGKHIAMEMLASLQPMSTIIEAATSPDQRSKISQRRM